MDISTTYLYRDGMADDFFSTRWFVNTWNMLFPDKKVTGVKEIALRASNGDNNAQSLFENFCFKFRRIHNPIPAKF